MPSRIVEARAIHNVLRPPETAVYVRCEDGFSVVIPGHGSELIEDRPMLESVVADYRERLVK